jgi:hypothetical protein
VSSRPVYLAVIVAAMSLATVRAQRFREPTAAERAVVQHYRDVVHDVLRQFPDANWTETIDYDIPDDFTVRPPVAAPLEVTDIIQASYQIAPGSPLYEREIAPLARQLAAMKDPAALARLASQRKVDRLTVQFESNVPVAEITPAPPRNADLHISGAALAFRVDSRVDRGTSVKLLFGDWKTATWQAGDSVYRFKFKSPRPSAAIENVAVQMDGSPERIDELLRTASWQHLADALTK